MAKSVLLHVCREVLISVLIACLIKDSIEDQVVRKHTKSYRRMSGKAINKTGQTKINQISTNCDERECTSKCTGDVKCTASEFISSDLRCYLFYCSRMEIVNSNNGIVNLDEGVF